MRQWFGCLQEQLNVEVLGSVEQEGASPAWSPCNQLKVLRILLLGSLLQLNLLVEGRKQLAVVLGIPSQCFKAVGLVFELNQQFVI